MENKYIKVANDCELQKEFIKDYNSFIEEFILLGNLVFEEGRSSIEANRKDILNMLDVNIVKLRKVYNFINSLDLLDTQEFEEVDINDIEIPFIFKSFWRGSNAKEKEGSGIGLFVAKEMAKRLGGDIYVKRFEETSEMEFVIFLCDE